MTKKTSIQKAIDLFIERRYDYFKQWIFDEPIVVSQTHHWLELIGLILFMTRKNSQKS